MTPSVDICIPLYNAEKTIERTLNSLVYQTYKNITIHIVDNVSTDRTLELIRAMPDNRILIHENTVHTQAGEHNWNRCMQYMNGDYGAIFHADDIYNPTMIEKQVAVLEQNPDICAAFVSAYVIDNNDKVIGGSKATKEYATIKKLTARDVLISTLKNHNTLICSCPLIRTDVYKNVLGAFNIDQFSYSSDLDMWMRAAHHSHITVIDEQLIKYRISASQGSNRLHHLRMAEDAFYYTMDYYIAKYADLPQDAIDKYEIRRMNDKILCISNFAKRMGYRLPGVMLWGLLTKMGFTCMD